MQPYKAISVPTDQMKRTAALPCLENSSFATFVFRYFSSLDDTSRDYFSAFALPNVPPETTDVFPVKAVSVLLVCERISSTFPD